MIKRSYTTILISGFGASGSGAVCDLLSEFDSFKGLKTEFRLMVDPDGILSLENALVNSWTPYQSDIAIKRFKKLIKKLSNRFSYPYFNLDYTSSFGHQFIEISNKYIERLISIAYSGLYFSINDPIRFLGFKLNQRLRKNIFNFPKPIYIFDPNDQFIYLTRKYLDELVRTCVLENNIRYIFIDEGYASMNPSRVLKYFYNARMIIVERDPRDTFVESISKWFFIPQDVNQFIDWYKFLKSRTLIEDNRNILRIKFEDLVIKYEQTLERIRQFLLIDESLHINKKQVFKPEVSIKNVGLWEKHKNPNDIEKIYIKLKKHCYIK